MNKPSDADLSLLRPAPDEIHDLVPHVMRHPVAGQSSPRLFFSAMCSAINSAKTSSLVRLSCGRDECLLYRLAFSLHVSRCCFVRHPITLFYIRPE